MQKPENKIRSRKNDCNPENRDCKRQRSNSSGSDCSSNCSDSDYSRRRHRRDKDNKKRDRNRRDNRNHRDRRNRDRDNSCSDDDNHDRHNNDYNNDYNNRNNRKRDNDHCTDDDNHHRNNDYCSDDEKHHNNDYNNDNCSDKHNNDYNNDHNNDCNDHCSNDGYRSDSCSEHSYASNCSSVKSDCRPDDCKDELYHYLKKRLLKDKSLMPFGSDAHGSFYSVATQIVNPAQAINFDFNQDALNIDHLPGEGNVYVRKNGVYFIVFIVDTVQACQFAIFVNDVIVPSSIAGKNAGAGQLPIHQLLELRKNDVISCRNFQSAIGAVEVTVNAGGSQPGTNTELVIVKVAPHPCDVPRYPKGRKWQDLSHKRKKLFKCIEDRMLCDKSLMLDNSNAHGSFWTLSPQDVAVGSSILFSNKSNVQNLQWTAGSGDVKVCKSGVYSMAFVIGTTKASQFTVFINGNPFTSTTAGTNQGSGQLILRQTLPLNADDVLSVRNYTSVVGTVTVSENAGGLADGVDASFVLVKISPLPSDLDPCSFVNEKLSCRKDDCNKDWDDDCHGKWKKIYNSFRRFLLRRNNLSVNGAQGYGALFRSSALSLSTGQFLPFSTNLNLKNIKHFQGKDELMVCSSGIYKYSLNVQTTEPAQFALSINGVVDTSTIYGNDSGANIVSAIKLLSLKKGDKIKVVNHISAKDPVNLSVNSGGLEVGFNASLILYKISQYC